MFGSLEITPYICVLIKIFMDKINLKEIAIESFPERESGYAFEDLDNVTKSYVIYSMKNAIKKALELASENGEVVYMSETLGEITLSSSESKKYVLKKSSITDVINNIK